MQKLEFPLSFRHTIFWLIIKPYIQINQLLDLPFDFVVVLWSRVVGNVPLALEKEGIERILEFITKNIERILLNYIKFQIVISDDEYKIKMPNETCWVVVLQFTFI